MPRFLSLLISELGSAVRVLQLAVSGHIMLRCRWVNFSLDCRVQGMLSIALVAGPLLVCTRSPVRASERAVTLYRVVCEMSKEQGALSFLKTSSSIRKAASSQQGRFCGMSHGAAVI